MQTDFCRRLGIEYPIFAFSHCRDVVAAVSIPVQAVGGLMSVTGKPGDGPMRVGIPIADLCAGIFAAQWMKFLTFGVILALNWHAWVGVRDIWMDYIKPVGARLVLQIFTIVWLVACAGWAIQVLWRL